MSEKRFWLAVDMDEPVWQEVTKEQYVSAERAAGFRNTLGQPEEPATGGFGARGVRGTTIDPHSHGR